MKFSRQHILILSVVSIAYIIEGFDSSVINIIMPKMTDYFDVDVGTISWMSLAYLLMIAGTVFIFSNLASRQQLKKLFLTGFILFTVASFFCGFTSNFEIMLVERLIQGLGASIIIACSPIICVRYLPPQILGLTFGLILSMSWVGVALGPAIGGIIAEYFPWQWVFFVNVPLGIFGSILCTKVLGKLLPTKDSEKLTSKSIDIIGSVVLFIAIVSFVLYLSSLLHPSYLNPVIINSLGIISAISGIFFVIHTLRSKFPVIHLRTLKNLKISGILLSNILCSIGCTSVFLLLPFYFVNQFQEDTASIGFLFSLLAITTAIFGVVFGKISDVYGRQKFCIFGHMLMAVSFAVFIFINPKVGIIPEIIALILFGFSIAVTAGPCSRQLIDHLPENEKEIWSSDNMALGFIAQAIGTAVWALLFTLLTESNSIEITFSELSSDGFMHGFKIIMGLGMLLFIISGLIHIFIRDKKDTL